MTDTVRVPKEPTLEMLKAGASTLDDFWKAQERGPTHLQEAWPGIVQIYAAMLAASPQGEGLSAEAELSQARSNAVGVGMVIAAAIVVDNCDVTAEEILHAAGLETVAKMKAAGCDDYDIDQLRSLVRQMNARRRRDAHKARTARSVGMSEANAPYRITEGVKP